MNADNCVGMSGTGCEANLQCKCTCDGSEAWFTRYTFTADGEDTCGTFCTPNQCRENISACNNASAIDAVCVNSDQVSA
jgi:hypothetical protein